MPLGDGSWSITDLYFTSDHDLLGHTHLTQLTGQGPDSCTDHEPRPFACVDETLLPLPQNDSCEKIIFPRTAYVVCNNESLYKRGSKVYSNLYGIFILSSDALHPMAFFLFYSNISSLKHC